jgi:hypothetical protein
LKSDADRRKCNFPRALFVYKYGDSKMSNATHSASRIKTLRLAVRPGASAITQLAAALTGHGRSRARAISVSGFFFPYSAGFPVLAYPGRKSLPPVFGSRRLPF